MPATEDDLLKRFDELGINTTLYRHPPMHTVEDCQTHRGNWPGGHCKSLFVRDNKNKQALIVVHEDRRVDLKFFAKAAGFGRLSFGSPDRMARVLGVIPGSVTPFALINTPENENLHIYLDADMMAMDPLYYHPLHNEATVAISSIDLLRFIDHCGHKPITFHFDPPTQTLDA